MKTNEVTCEQFRAWLVDRRAGTLDAADQAGFDGHRALCADCAREAEFDEKLVAAIEALPQEAPPPTSWSRVLQTRNPAPVTRPARRLTLAFASVTTVAALLFALNAGLDDGVPPVTPETTASSETATYVRAHSLVSASGFSGDPNRDVILLYATPAPKETDS